MLPCFLGLAPPVQIDLIWSTDCPVAQRWVTRVAAWQSKHPAAQVNWWFPADDSIAASAYAKRFGLRGSIHGAEGSELAFQFALDRFPSLVVRQGSETVFVGGVGASADPDSRFLLAEAYAAAASESVMIPSRSEPQGCTLPDSLVERAGSPVTYMKHVKPLIQKYCLPCHAPGGAAPFRLDRYPDARRWSHMILDVLQRGKMPPVRVYNLLQRRSPAPSSVEVEQLRVWREYGAPEGRSPSSVIGSDSDPTPLSHSSPMMVVSPKMGRFRFVDLFLPKLERTSGFTVTGAPQGSVRMVWTFLAPHSGSSEMVDRGERWRVVPHDWEFVHASQPNIRNGIAPYFFFAKGKVPVVRLLLYGNGEPRQLKFSIVPIPMPKTGVARSLRFPIESGRFPAFDGIVEQTSLLLAQEVRPLSLTVIADPAPTTITLLGPSRSLMIAEFTPGSFMPTVMLGSPSNNRQIGFNATYGGHSLTGARGPSSIVFGERWNEARLEAYLVIPAQQ